MGKPARAALLAAGALALLLAGTARAAFPQAPAHDPAERRVVWIILGGGVRTADLLEGPKASPTLAALVSGGTAYLAAKSAAQDSARALRNLLSGSAEDTAADAAPSSPTLAECVRRQGALPASSAWLVLSSGLAPSGPWVSSHAEGGKGAAPGIISPDALLSPEIQTAVRALRARAPERSDEGAIVRDLLAKIRTQRAGAPEAGAFDPAASLALQDFITRECLSPDADATPGAGDRRALRAAAALLAGARPRLLVVALSEASLAERGYQRYRAVLEGFEPALAAFVKVIQEDPVLKATVTIAVATDFGRNKKPSADDTLRRDDGGPDLGRGVIILNGPAVKPGQQIKTPVNGIDLAPTLASILGFKMPLSKGRPLKGALQ